MAVAERRARLALRHHLAQPARGADLVTVAGDLVGLHATDAVSVFLGARARMKAIDPADIERLLYEDRTLLRTLCMRRTLFVVPVATVLPIVQAAAAKAIAVRERTRVHGFIEAAGITDDPEPWLRSVERATLVAVRARGEAAAAELSQDVPALREKLSFGEGRKWAGTMGVSTRALLLLSLDGRIGRGRPRGTWLSTQHRWAPIEAWCPDGIPVIPVADARVELGQRWLGAFGPGTEADLRWWTGWTLTETRRVLQAVAAEEVDLEGAVGYVLPGDTAPTSTPKPWVAFLPALDTTTMGWTDRGWYLGAHKAALFDRAGNAGPTVWADGRIVGGWAQRRSGEIAYRILEDVGRVTTDAIATEAERVAAWLGAVRFVPRFRTPLERDLAT
jgi:hypothetical protein